LTRKYSRELLQVSKELRKSQTEAEEIIWEELKAKKLNGLKFRRQVPYDTFVIDFLCPSKKVILEIDGKIHLKTKFRDQERDEYFMEKGYKVLRIKNEEVFHNLDDVLQRIKKSTRNDILYNLFPKSILLFRRRDFQPMQSKYQVLPC